jgi:hypothetical protein
MSKITNHAESRGKDRMGLNKKAIKRIAEKSLTKGLKHSDFKGSFKRYLDGIYLRHGTANNMRIFNNEVFIFKEDILITILDIPYKYHKVIEQVKEREE